MALQMKSTSQNKLPISLMSTWWSSLVLQLFKNEKKPSISTSNISNTNYVKLTYPTVSVPQTQQWKPKNLKRKKET